MSGLARTTDPATSHAAAARIRQHTSQENVLALALELRDFTDHELIVEYRGYVAQGRLAPASDARIRTARKELVRQGHLRDAGMTRLSEYGREMTVWEIA